MARERQVAHHAVVAARHSRGAWPVRHNQQLQQHRVPRLPAHKAEEREGERHAAEPRWTGAQHRVLRNVAAEDEVHQRDADDVVPDCVLAPLAPCEAVPAREPEARQQRAEPGVQRDQQHDAGAELRGVERLVEHEEAAAWPQRRLFQGLDDDDGEGAGGKHALHDAGQ